MAEALALSGMTAFITGGSAGIGGASAEMLARDGAAVTIMGRRPEKLEEKRAEILAKVPGAKVSIHAGDGLDEASLQAGMAAAAAPTGRIDILVVTVGHATSFGPLLTVDLATFRRDLESNVVGPVLSLRHAAPYMQRGASAVFISSTAGFNSFRYIAGYACAKAALEHVIRTGADELGSQGIRLNGVRTGMTLTEDTAEMFADKDMMAAFDGCVPLERLGKVEDIAAAVRYLAGPESSWVTGELLTVDGGQHVRNNPDFGYMFGK